VHDRGDNQALKPQPSGGRERPGEILRASLAESAIGLRPAGPADAGFCYQLHKAAMGEYIAAIWGWDEQVQHAFHERAFNPHRWQIITAGQADVGMLDVDCRAPAHHRGLTSPPSLASGSVGHAAPSRISAHSGVH
jgi:hypothetical protein